MRPQQRAAVPAKEKELLRKGRDQSTQIIGTGQMQNEAGAVVLGCVGLLTLLALRQLSPGMFP